MIMEQMSSCHVEIDRGGNVISPISNLPPKIQDWSSISHIILLILKKKKTVTNNQDHNNNSNNITLI